MASVQHRRHMDCRLVAHQNGRRWRCRCRSAPGVCGRGPGGRDFRAPRQTCLCRFPAVCRSRAAPCPTHAPAAHSSHGTLVKMSRFLLLCLCSAIITSRRQQTIAQSTYGASLHERCSLAEDANMFPCAPPRAQSELAVCRRRFEHTFRSMWSWVAFQSRPTARALSASS